MAQINIAIADNCEVSRKGIAKLLGEVPQFNIVVDCKFAGELLQVVRAEYVDVVIMDLNLPDLSDIETVRSLKNIRPQLGILIFTSRTDVELLVQLAKAGVSSYQRKVTPLKKLIHTIEIIHQGDTYFPKKISSILFNRLSDGVNIESEKSKTKPCITPREIEILKLISEELTNKEIAGRLFISPRTVDTHRRNLLSKLDVKNTAGLMKYYFSLREKDGPIEQYSQS